MEPLQLSAYQPSKNTERILGTIGALEPLQLSRYQAAAYDRYPGSGRWFLLDLDYLRWKNDKDKILLVQGTRKYIPVQCT